MHYIIMEGNCIIPTFAAGGDAEVAPVDNCRN